MSLEKAWSDGEREGVADCGLGGQVNAFPVHVSGCCTQRERGQFVRGRLSTWTNSAPKDG